MEGFPNQNWHLAKGHLSVHVAAHIQVTVVDEVRGQALEPVIVHLQAGNHQLLRQNLALHLQKEQ